MSELPNGWINTKIEDIAAYVQRGKSPKYIDKSDLPVINQKCIRWSGVDPRYLKFIHPDQWDSWTSERFLQKGDILWNSTGTGTIGRAALYKNLDGYERVVVDSHVTIVRANEACNSSFLHYFIRSSLVQSKIEDMQSGSTNQVELSRGQVINTTIPLAPLNEQKRIADKLDRLLAKVDNCRERLDRIPIILKRFRQSILATATSGELTEDWRNKNPINTSGDSLQVEPTGDFLNVVESANYILPETWKWLTPDLIKNSEKHSLSIGPFGSSMTVKDYRDSGIPLVFVRDIRARKFGDKRTKFISEEKAKELWAHRVEPGDLLITKMGDPPGDTAIFSLNRPVSIITADCIRIKPNAAIASVEFLSLFIESNLVRALMQTITAGVAQQKMSLQRFRVMPLPIPPIQEQREIVRRVEKLFDFADRLEARYQTARAQIDKLTPALLDKAFKGELVPQDPADEPASVLLAKIQQARAHPETTTSKQPKTPRKPSIPKIKMLTRSTIQPSHLADILKNSGSLTAEALWNASKLSIDDFYDQLKAEELQELLKEVQGELSTSIRLLEAI